MGKIIRSGLFIVSSRSSCDCGEQLDFLFRLWEERLDTAASQEVTNSVAFTFWTPSAAQYWKSINGARKKWWLDSCPTSTFIELKTRPDGRPWGNAVVAMEAVAVIGDELDKRQSFYLDGVVNQPDYCHAKLLHFPDRRELFFSGVVALTETAAGELKILGPNNLWEQLGVCVEKIEELCKKAEMPKGKITSLEVFLPEKYYKFAGGVIEQLLRRVKAPEITCRQVNGLFMPGLLVEIRPHAVAWK